MIIEISLTLALLLSLSANIFMLWYVRNLLRNMLELIGNIVEFQGELSLYREHLQSIYDLEMFYGDETLGGLLDHGKSLIESIDKFDEFIDLLDGEEMEEEEEEMDIQQQEDYDDGNTTATAETFAKGKTVFHAGP
tara:strand:+ start:19616 stop:20023 length:408 start_codon:yes stop_codon:yes gene_type:complete